MWLMPDHIKPLWFIQQTGAPGTLDIGVNLEIEGGHDPDDLRMALGEAVRKHAVFRLRFGVHNGESVCWLQETASFGWDIVDLDGREDAWQDRCECAVAEHGSSIEIENGPLIVATLFRCGAKRSLLCFSTNQLVADAMTLRIVVEDFLRAWLRIHGEHVEPRAPSADYRDALVAVPDGPVSPIRSAGSDLAAATRPVTVAGNGPVRPAGGSEAAVAFGGPELVALKDAARRSGGTLFAALLACLGPVLGGAGYDPSSDVGIMVSHRDLRRFRRTAGCFAQLARFPLDLARCGSGGEAIRAVADRLDGIRAGLRRGTVQASPDRVPVMISMVRDGATRLSAPDGVTVRYRRRKRTHAECDLQVFIYDLGTSVEIVFNYDLAVLDPARIAVLMNQFRTRCADLDRDPLVAREAGNPGGAPGAPPVHFHHIGVAAWELDLGVRRLAEQGVAQTGDVVTDPVAGVAFALAGPIRGVLLELVAPLRQDAPCIGALVRNGEGAYHMCWQVGGLDEATRHLARCGVAYDVLGEGRSSPLFAGCSFVFLLVAGFGLVELLTGGEGQATSRPPGTGGALRVEVRSGNIANGRRFLAALGYSESSACTGKGSVWVRPDVGPVVCLDDGGADPDEYVRIAESPRGDGADCRCRAAGGCEAAGAWWWDRMRIGRPPSRSVGRVETRTDAV
ncbi:MAG: condensation domain-containing protein [bacterium]